MNYRTTQLGGITDLTLIAPIKPGLVKGSLETLSYTERLRRTLALLDAVRKRARESRLTPSPFPDPVGRLRGIHFFRYAILPAGLAPHGIPEPDRLILNVSFDGGWEPYIRQIWGPIGMLLDLIFCHCDGYPLAHASRFDDYMRWVRQQEIPADFFYTDGAATVGDRRYHAALEALIDRHAGNHGLPDEIARLALPPTTPPTPPTDLAARQALALLSALALLRPAFPAPHDDAGVLLRFTQDLLSELRGWVSAGDFDPNGRFAGLRPAFASPITWLMTPRGLPATPSMPPLLDLGKVQAGIATSLPAAPVGLLCLLRITDAAAFKAWLKTAPVTRGDAAVSPCENNGQAVNPVVSLALTYTGMRALGVAGWRLERLPQEFKDGMEGRASVLGDVRVNHPEQWRRPRLADGTVLDLRLVHVLVQLRTAACPGETECCAQNRLLRWLTQQVVPHGLALLATQEMASRGVAGQAPRGHLGFADGISQPVPFPPALPSAYWSDQVAPGELFLGHPNARDRLPREAVDGPEGDLLMDDGSFMVVRKLRQHLDRMNAQLRKQAEAALPPGDPRVGERIEAYLRLMVGRNRDGSPLVRLTGHGDNDFDYRGDPAGQQCPFAAHVRRLNPRASDRDQALPRIARRGMSYGPPLAPGAQPAPQDERGLMFIAWCASIAEQFEVLQRWSAGGNASGLSSAQADPLLGVPEPGRQRIFRCTIEGQAHTLDLGDQAWVTLQWGMYAFAPSPRALERIDVIVDPHRGPVAGKPPAPQPGNTGLDHWRTRLEDRPRRDATWTEVVRKGGVEAAGSYGVLIGGASPLQQILRDNGAIYSVRGYGDRMRESIGLGYLGQDEVGANQGHKVLADAVNKVIEDFRGTSKTADGLYVDAVEAAAKSIARLTQVGPGPWVMNLPLFVGQVLADLCGSWFGLPDTSGEYMASGIDPAEPGRLPNCPGSFLPVSRYIFSSPHPSPELAQLGKDQGALIRRQVRQWIQDTQANPGLRGPLTTAILQAVPGGTGTGMQADTLAGVMLGFPPTVMGNLVNILLRWVDDGELWETQFDLQQQMNNAPTRSAFNVADAVLHESIIDAMSRDPVPYTIWRQLNTATQCPYSLRFTAVGALQPTINDTDTKLVLGLGAAARTDPWLMFGGRRDSRSPDFGLHACPGYTMALQVMMGTLAALMTARTTAGASAAKPLSLRPGDSRGTLKLVL
ncbi:MAG: Dyp-type peroxidase [Betaproteobacteria bacterium]|nr:Dyp-type peroxidase [Betaproteobacteria bacterium]